jgi:hypothetical protein
MVRNDVPIYRICVRGHLDTRWKDWLDGMTMAYDQATDVTCFAGPVRDQAHLHGLLAQVRDAGLQLISVTRQDEPA